MEKNIAVIYGDCASPEIVTQALRVLDAVAEKFGHTFTYTKVLMGGEAIDAYGDPLPQSELDKCLQSDSVLLGAIGGPKWEGLPGDKRAEKGLLRLRAGMGLYSNNRPAKIWPQLADASPLKPAIVEKGIDFIVVRELIGGVYFGEHRTYEENGEKVAVDTMPYSEHEIERIGRIGFETARKRRKKLTCVDKANVLETSLNNSNPISHGPLALFNITRMENGEDFLLFGTGVTPRVARFMEKIDRERVAVVRACGVSAPTELEMLNSFWPEPQESLYNVLHNTPAYSVTKGPRTLDHRYLTEDLPYGLVPYVRLGRKLGVETPCLEALIGMFGLYMDQDYFQQGPEVEQLDLSRYR